MTMEKGKFIWKGDKAVWVKDKEGKFNLSLKPSRRTKNIVGWTILLLFGATFISMVIYTIG